VRRRTNGNEFGQTLNNAEQDGLKKGHFCQLSVVSCQWSVVSGQLLEVRD
jgi:hypothetical protein